MAKPIPFTEHETALLLDAYLKVLSGELSRMGSVRECSKLLRLMAINSGVGIDDVYRNVNGIALQMASMESAYQGKTIMKPATRLFTEMVFLYRNDNVHYQELLREAKDMARAKPTSEAMFMSWLSENVSTAQLTELYLALHEIEQHAKKAKFIKMSIYENFDVSIIKRIKSGVEQNKIFKFTHKRQWECILSALSYLLQFANEILVDATAKKDLSAEVGSCSTVADLTPVVSPEVPNKENGDVAITPTVGSVVLEQAKEPQSVIAVDFHNIDSMAFSKPISLSYFGEKIMESSWKALYVDACKFLLEDYPDIFSQMKTESISGVGKTWLVDEQHVTLLVAPKKVAEAFFVETNRSASDLVKNLRWILDKCSVDYESVVITYTRKNEQDISRSYASEMRKPARQYYREDKETFCRWLKEDQHMTEGTCRSYVSAIRSAERFAEEYDLISKKLYTTDPNEAKATADALFANAEFLQRNNEQHNRFRAAIAKLLLFVGSNWSLSDYAMTGHPQKNLLSVLDMTPYINILIEHFSKGYRLGSALDMKRLRRYYETLTGVVLEVEQSKIEAAMTECGITYDGKLYMPQAMLSVDMREQVFSFVDRCFEEGRSAVYYEALFREFSEKFLDYHIYNVDMLKAYLSYYLADKYYIGRDYLSKEVRTDIDPIDEIRQCLKEYDRPIQVDELYALLSHISADRIRTVLGSNGEFVRNSKGEYFHADSLELTEEELKDIAAVVNDSITEHEFISGNELCKAIQTKYPHMFEKNASFSVIGWRDALKYKFGDQFSFMGNIISKAGTPLTMSDVFSNYSKAREQFTIDELDQFAESIGATIYFDALYVNAIRISHHMFVSKDSAKFFIKETDAVLERFCKGNYIPLSAITEFAIFPDASFPWTEYLLEQYVAFYSEKFYLLHGNYSKGCAVGAIVRRTCRFETFDELVTDILSENDIPLQKKEVLDYLTDNKYIARRSYTNIESLIINARARRNQKEK